MQSCVAHLSYRNARQTLMVLGEGGRRGQWLSLFKSHGTEVQGGDGQICIEAVGN